MQELANTAWAFAAAGKSDAQLFAALARVAELRVSNFNMQELANIAWAFATAVDASLFSALVRAAKRIMSEFDTARVETIANFMWGLARIKAKASCVMYLLGMSAANCLR